jgi:hypothetical protein
MSLDSTVSPEQWDAHPLLKYPLEVITSSLHPVTLCVNTAPIKAAQSLLSTAQGDLVFYRPGITILRPATHFYPTRERDK